MMRRSFLKSVVALAGLTLVKELTAPVQVLYIGSRDVVQNRLFVGAWKFVCEPGATILNCCFRMPQALQLELTREPTAIERQVTVMGCTFDGSFLEVA